MRRFALFAVLCLVPLSVFSQDGALTRRDGFLLIWEGIRRDPDPTSETPFRDVPKGERGSAQITYAKARGLLDDAESFFPDEPLLFRDAVLWLLRTRNVADLDAMTPEALPVLLQRYPFVEQSRDLALPLSSTDALLALSVALDQMLAEEVHETSLYSEKFHGKGTACGEPFDMYALTAAHRTFPCNTLVKVTNIGNQQSVIVRINDRGPYVDGRDMDLSLEAFTRIAPRSQGVAQVRFERLGDDALVDSCDGAVRRYQKRITRDVRFDRGVPHASPIGSPIALTSVRPFVVRSIVYPDGSTERIEDWVNPGEVFSFTPSLTGLYSFRVGSVDGRVRDMQMNAWECAQ
ncbi:MAG: rare lipoprotein A [Candidatus Peribacter riflensis]|uniref:Probable endolytic peptidoglycan transglycosylase RlpA n=1 Tax=Candidatus Peribacter riflensis TaxID=1735162 RepID=A0A0S1SLQ9_9BACT|nr:MAG: rare lipoprotein A [Candidatus Peribacter riflensis]ALM10804.1 MAG: rare lipoprotein A [Candidatus Peribacter riflensis]ALM11906.1 MAG: rare lipoprotein A [Candidatus Peribacter riflensis]ALM13009.1 MAG: rare lipoprotein A [Candidatus Peribacter riflensis]ALM14109.1 MAG: rare lipoprotein A [Candidatus Peribacter riflensis]